MMIFHWPQITWCVLTFVGLAAASVQRGKPVQGHYNFMVRLIKALVAVWLLWCGGFFSQADAAEP
ncbi:lytic transglycosylase domain-containing protein, partial [Salmonella enterica subsp. enterica serovar Rubislaw]|nr:lytic transglycosylase domain-containing protein [Salmonella enterica subsp. enterica serovar Rubislaw]